MDEETERKILRELKGLKHGLYCLSIVVGLLIALFVRILWHDPALWK